MCATTVFVSIFKDYINNTKNLLDKIKNNKYNIINDKGVKMLKSVAFPSGWFTAKEIGIAAATLRAYVNDNILEVNKNYSPMKYRVIPTTADLNSIFNTYPNAAFVLVHSDNFITSVKRKNDAMIVLLDELDDEGKLQTAPFIVSPYIKYINVYGEGQPFSINLSL